jgi:hypothetical protein
MGNRSGGGQSRSVAWSSLTTLIAQEVPNPSGDAYAALTSAS